MTHNFEAVVSVLFQICGQICRGMPYLCIFVEEVVPLLGEMTDKLVLMLSSHQRRFDGALKRRAKRHQSVKKLD